MNPTPARQLKRFAEACRSRPPTTQRDRDRYVYILEAAQDMLIDTGRNRFTLPEFALCVGLSQLTIRRQISDLHHLFALVLSKHLDAILAAVGAIPFDSPDLFARRRLAYGRATRGICGIPTPLHFLLVRDRFTLPDDELESIDKQRRVIAFLVGRENGEDIMNLLDSPTLDLEKIEAMIAAMERMDESRRAGARPKPLLDCIVYDEPEPEPPPPPRARIQPAKPFPMTGLSPELANMSDAELTAYENGRIPYPPPEHRHEHGHEHEHEHEHEIADAEAGAAEIANGGDIAGTVEVVGNVEAPGKMKPSSPDPSALLCRSGRQTRGPAPRRAPRSGGRRLIPAPAGIPFVFGSRASGQSASRRPSGTVLPFAPKPRSSKPP